MDITNLKSYIQQNDITNLRAIKEADLTSKEKQDLIKASIFYSRIEVLELFQKKQFDLHMNEEEALKLAIELDRPFEIIHLLIKDNADLLINNKEIVIKSAISDNLKVAKLIYQHCPDDEIFSKFGGQKVQKWINKILLQKLNQALHKDLPKQAELPKNKL